jgi:hypothetical protein
VASVPLFRGIITRRITIGIVIEIKIKVLQKMMAIIKIKDYELLVYSE